MNRLGLFVLHEGVGSTIFKSQVLEHVVAMERVGIQMSILTFETFQKVRKASKRNLRKIGVSHQSTKIDLKFGMNIYWPLSTLVNAFLLSWHILRSRDKYSFIHARADYSAFLCLLTKPIHGLPVIWDCRGDAKGELEDALSRQPELLRHTIGAVLVIRQRIIAALVRRFSDGAVFVSKELMKCHVASLRTNNCSIIPCPVPEDRFFYDEGTRERMRNQLGLSELDRVFIYSGSTVAYQGLEEQITLYKKILSVPNNVIFFATLEPDYARELFNDLLPGRFHIVSVEYDEINDFYNLSDFAFMLREAKNLNWVASPTKFGEYCLTGLATILNDTVQQASENARTLGNYVHVDDVLDVEPLHGEHRQAIAEKAMQIYSRKTSLHTYSDLYATAIM